MIQPGKSFLKFESFLCPDKQGTPEEGRRIQQVKHCGKNNKDEDNSLKTLTDKNYQALIKENILVLNDLPFKNRIFSFMSLVQKNFQFRSPEIAAHFNLK